MGFGTSLGELAWLGTPHLSITHHARDDRHARRLEAHGIGLHLGFAPELTADAVRPKLRRGLLDRAWQRAGIGGADDIDGIETHDCFTTSEYMAIDHFGITKPGESWKAIEAGWLEIDGKYPINPSGGLIGAGHPVGATGVRQLLDGYKQVTGQAGDYQVEGAKNFQTLNIGGSGTTSCSFVVGV